MAGGERKRGGGLRPRPGRARGVLGTVFGVILAGALGTVVVGMLRLGGARDVSLSGSIRQPPTGLPSTWNFVPAMGRGKAGADIRGAKTGEGNTGRQRAPPGEERPRKGTGADGLRKGVAQQSSTQGVEAGRGGGGLVSASDRGGASEAAPESESIPDRYHVVLSTGGGGGRYGKTSCVTTGTCRQRESTLIRPWGGSRGSYTPAGMTRCPGGFQRCGSIHRRWEKRL